MRYHPLIRVRFASSTYFFASLFLLLIEILIALFVRDTFVRGYLGDVLAVMLVYAVLRAVRMNVVGAVLAALAIALVIELAQAFDLRGALGLSDNQVVRVVLGGVFDLMDLVAYASGALLILGCEMAVRRGR